MQGHCGRRLNFLCAPSPVVIVVITTEPSVLSTYSQKESSTPPSFSSLSLSLVSTSRPASCTRSFAFCTHHTLGFTTMIDAAQGRLFGSIFKVILDGSYHLFLVISLIRMLHGGTRSPEHRCAEPPSMCKLLTSVCFWAYLPPSFFATRVFAFDDSKQSTSQTPIL